MLNTQIESLQKFVIKCKGQYLKVKVAEQVLELIKQKKCNCSNSYTK